ncbi:MAG: LysM peptidoglycan-binding domain-containing protein [Verrucomicrobia bacterium]|nr:MAG: LysM peptidoglycan-binding domain-containing protein [Verrucomicrobiota bacterium]
MQTVEQKSQWKSRAVFCAVAGVHIVAASALLFIYGCSTTKAPKPEAPAAPVMPPTKEPSPVVEKPMIPPPPPVDLAPAAKETAASKTYVVQAGDSLSKIAHHAGVSQRELMELNGIKNANMLRVGQKITLPAYSKELAAGSAKKTAGKKATSSKKASAKAATEAPAGAGTYVVKAGDSLAKIAKHNGVKISALREANKISGDRIRVGQKLVIPGKAAASETAPAATPEAVAAAGAAGMPAATGEAAVVPAPAAPTALLDYTVQEGETLDSVAKTFMVKKEDIMKANGATDAAQIKPGMRIKIPAPIQ